MSSRSFVLQLLTEVGAIVTDSHIVYTSDKHGSVYVNKDAVYPHTMKTSDLCRDIASCFDQDNVEVVVAPAVGGVILSQWVAYHLSVLSRRDVLGVYAEKEVLPISDHYGQGRKCFAETGRFTFLRGYHNLIAGKRVLVVEDILNTGGSAKKVVEAVTLASGNVIGVGAICNRGGVTAADIGHVPKLAAILELSLEAWSEADCPLCAKGVPINTTVGKGRAFLARKQQA